MRDPQGCSRHNPAWSVAGNFGKTVVVVDDEPDIVESIAMVLEGALPDVRVLPTVSPQQALEYAKAGASLLVTDYRMPSMDGFELAQQAQDIDHALPILMVTAFEDKGIQAKATTMGLELVYKPFEPHRLVQLVAGILAS